MSKKDSEYWIVIDICVIEVGQLIINRYLLDSYVYGKKDDSSG